MNAREEIDKLREQIEYHSHRYYDMDEPEISDNEYDTLMNRLKELEKANPELITKDSPTQKVGGQAKREAGALVKHNVPMLSLRDVFSKEEVMSFVEDMQNAFANPEFVVEYKIDGLSMSLRYENGKLVMAETRGDGIEYGEDVTANALMIDDVVPTLKDPFEYFEIRGEVYMTNESFDNVNKKQELLGKKTFANPRNCAAGSLRQLDSKIVKERNLSLFIFNLQQARGRDFPTHTSCYEYMKSQGIKVIDNYKVCKTAEDVWQAICDIGDKRGELGYDIDGAVVKLNSYEERRIAGTTSKVPKWAVAYKYPPEEKETVLTDVELTVGRTGRINPTAIFNPIRLCGTTVSRATMHNQDFIDDLDIGIGDTIVVYKSGEIIPKIKNVVRSKRPSTTTTYKIPDVCPVCGAKTLRDKDSANIVCTSPTCPAQLENHIINFVGRDAMDIKGFGSTYIIDLVREGYIKDIADIYTLYRYRDELVDKGIIGKEGNTDKLLKVIDNSKSNGAVMLLTGLGIPNIGKGAAKNLIKHFGSIDSLMNADKEAITKVDDIGDISAESIYEYFHNEKNVDIIMRLKEYGVNMQGQIENSSDALLGKTFVITGTLPTMGRKEAAALIESNGGKCSSSVSKKTDYLVAGENAGSKLKKAQDLGVEVISEDMLVNMIK
ncbi:MAG: NAD-dependent DNA ligase LigA [Lachnospiraceae bacterium]|nr:NAD-dependent DNA ligase LigA [Lachnospiraceae bacterium]